MAAEPVMGAGEDYGEEKGWAEAREAREKVSGLMGQYLLKGYRMLGVNCTECENILLRKRGDATNYCVYCEEVANAPTKISCNSAPNPPSSGSGVSTTNTHARPSSPPPSSPKVTKPSSMDSEHRVPVVCSGKTTDTFKLTTSPADHDKVKVCSDTKRNGVRTNPGVLQSTGKRRTPPSDHTHSEKIVKRGASTEHLLDQPLTSIGEASLECQSVLVAKLKWCSRELEASQSLENSVVLCRLITSIGEALRALKTVDSTSAVESGPS